MIPNLGAFSAKVVFPGGSEGKASSCNVGNWVQPLGWKDPLEKGMATHSSTLTGRIPRTEEAGGLQSMGSQRVGHDRATHTHNRILLSHKKYEILPFVTT